MKTPKLIELQRNRLTAIDEARAVLTEIDGAAETAIPALEARHHAAMRKLDLIDLDIQEEEIRGGYGAEGREQQLISGRPPFAIVNSFEGRDDSAFGGSAKWTDVDGNGVRVLARGDRFEEGRQQDGLSLGHMMRAMALGTTNEAERRALAEGTDSAGGYTVPTPLAGNFIDKLRAAMVTVKAGAVTVPMVSKTLSIARVDADPVAAWRAENSLVTEGDVTFGRVSFDAKSLACMVKMSRELFEDSVNAVQALENALVSAMALQFDAACLYGSGSSNEPLGLAGTSGINAVSMGTNGAAFANYNPIIDSIYENLLDNAALPTAAIMHPRTWLGLQKLVDSTGNPLTVPKVVADVPQLSTTSVPINETKGTASGICSSILLGDYRDMMIGMRNNIRLEIFRETFADKLQIGFIAHMRADVQFARKESFCRLSGIKAS